MGIRIANLFQALCTLPTEAPEKKFRAMSRVLGELAIEKGRDVFSFPKDFLNSKGGRNLDRPGRKGYDGPVFCHFVTAATSRVLSSDFPQRVLFTRVV
jgi:hypothetical protein